MMLLRFTLLFLLTMPLSAWAANNVPIPKSKSDVIQSTSPEIKTKVLSQKVDRLEGDLKTTRKKMVRVGQKIQTSERNLNALEKRMREIHTRKADLQETLEKERGAISQLILALQRIERIPPQALIARPDAPLATAQGAMILQDILPVLSKRADELRDTVKELDQITQELSAKQAKMAQASKKLKSEQENLATLVKKRERLYTNSRQDLDAQKERAAMIARQARTLRDLVRRIDRDKKAAQPGPSAPPSSPREIQITRKATNAHSQLPVSGIVRVNYNDVNELGARHKGIDIETRGGALAVAPMQGTVRFSGQFKNYGNLIIIEHPQGYHSLIAGLEGIDTQVGAQLSAGEPLGKLPRLLNGKKPVLYYELRHNGEAINPAKKFSELS